MVRSKSEVFIDIVLSQNNIPYRYENELLLDGKQFYPDFTLLNPVTKELIYWEHLGLMSNHDYVRMCFNKLRTYHQHGITPGVNLILTFESTNNPFSFTDAEAALKQMKLI